MGQTDRRTLASLNVPHFGGGSIKLMGSQLLSSCVRTYARITLYVNLSVGFNNRLSAEGNCRALLSAAAAAATVTSLTIVVI